MSATGPFFALLACVAFGSAHAALAEPLNDPTRPPNVTGAPGSDVAEAEAPRQLQSVLISRGRKLAIINGETVALGGHLGEAVVAGISETEVVLRFPDHSETLKLLGGIERKPVTGESGKGRK